MKTWVAQTLFAILLSSAAEAAATKLAVLPFEGPKASVARGQLANSLCREIECVSPAKVGRGAKPDFKKARRDGVDLVVTGRVSGPVSKRVLTLTVWGANGKQLSKDTFRLARNGKLSRTEQEGAQERILAAAAWTQPKPAAEGETPPLAESTPPENDPGLLPETMPREDAGMAAAQESPVAEDVRILPLDRRQPLLWVEAGADFTHRSFNYSGLAVPNLRAYETQPALFAPKFQAAVFPLSRTLGGVAAGLGIEAGYQFAVGLKSVDENKQAHPTTATRLDLGARLDLRPIAGSGLMISPQLGYRSATFAVGAADDGKRLAGLPDLTYDSVRLGAESEMPFDAMVVFAKAHYLQALRLGEIGAEPYFPKSSGSGLEGTIGAGYRVIENVEVRLSLNYTRYGLSFEAEPAATYVATGATDQYLGGALTARFVY